MRSALAALLVLASFAAPRSAQAQRMDELLAGVPAFPGEAVIVAIPAQWANAGPLPTSVMLGGDAPEGVWNTVLLTAAGAAGGGIGMFAGMLAGALIDGKADPDCPDMCFGPGIILGTLAGEALGVALGVHLANGRRGSLPLGSLVSAGVLAMGLVSVVEMPVMILVIPVSQIYGAIKVERATARRRER